MRTLGIIEIVAQAIVPQKLVHKLRLHGPPQRHGIILSWDRADGVDNLGGIFDVIVPVLGYWDPLAIIIGSLSPHNASFFVGHIEELFFAAAPVEREIDSSVCDCASTHEEKDSAVRLLNVVVRDTRRVKDSSPLSGSLTSSTQGIHTLLEMQYVTNACYTGKQRTAATFSFDASHVIIWTYGKAGVKSHSKRLALFAISCPSRLLATWLRTWDTLRQPLVSMRTRYHSAGLRQRKGKIIARKRNCARWAAQGIRHIISSDAVREPASDVRRANRTLVRFWSLRPIRLGVGRFAPALMLELLATQVLSHHHRVEVGRGLESLESPETRKNRVVVVLAEDVHVEVSRSGSGSGAHRRALTKNLTSALRDHQRHTLGNKASRSDYGQPVDILLVVLAQSSWITAGAGAAGHGWKISTKVGGEREGGKHAFPKASPLLLLLLSSSMRFRFPQNVVLKFGQFGPRRLAPVAHIRDTRMEGAETRSHADHRFNPHNRENLRHALPPQMRFDERQDPLYKPVAQVSMRVFSGILNASDHVTMSTAACHRIDAVEDSLCSPTRVSHILGTTILVGSSGILNASDHVTMSTAATAWITRSEIGESCINFAFAREAQSFVMLQLIALVGEKRRLALCSIGFPTIHTTLAFGIPVRNVQRATTNVLPISVHGSRFGHRIAHHSCAAPGTRDTAHFPNFQDKSRPISEDRDSASHFAPCKTG
ncbi:hypothetical protein DFH06DRAFT_1129093 [Mycena polygramma]|nr:hypothetical protein DFH06DRAFT_1129093 [Mycena polygramma]